MGVNMSVKKVQRLFMGRWCFRKKIHPVNWKIVYLIKEKGGLGFVVFTTSIGISLATRDGFGVDVWCGLNLPCGSFLMLYLGLTQNGLKWLGSGKLRGGRVVESKVYKTLRYWELELVEEFIGTILNKNFFFCKG